MAKNVKTTETALKTGTIATPGMGHNQPPVELDANGYPRVVEGWDAPHCLAIAQTGFAEDAKADKAKGSALQRVTAACMGLFAANHAGTWEVSETIKLAPLSEMLLKVNAEKATSALNILFGVFIGKDYRTPKQLEAMEDADAKAAYEIRVRNMKNLIRKGIRTAAILHSKGVTLANWNQAEACFEVTNPLLVEPEWMGMGRLSDSMKTLPLLLDNRSYILVKQGKNGAVSKKVRASCDQLDVVWRAENGIVPTTRTPTPGGDESAETKAAELTASTIGQFVKSSNDNLGATITAVYQRLEADAAHWTHASFDEKHWNNAVKLATLILKITQRPNFKAPPGASVLSGKSAA